MELLTSSRLSALRRCPRSHYYRYELGLVRVREQTPLRFGSVFHKGLELVNQGGSCVEAVLGATAGYDVVPLWADPAEWALERVTVASLLVGHFWRYGEDGLKVREVELKFELPLVNPETGAESRTFRLAGKVDAIVELPDGRLAVLEYKTAGEEIGPDAAYWLRLRCDPQISLYYDAVRALGWEVSTVLYDATRKPSIGPRNVPVVDGEGLPIVLDQAGNRVLTKSGKPRQTGSTADGYVLQARPESPEEFSDRLLQDIEQRPDFYFARREVPRLEDELEAFRCEVWQQAQQLAETRRRAAKATRPEAAWFRSVGRFTCDGCQFSNICLNNISVAPGDVPVGYVHVEDVNTELAA